MRRWHLGWGALVLLGCASGPDVPPEAPPAERCREADPLCALHSEVEPRETKAEVVAAERARRRSEFARQVAGWRARLDPPASSAPGAEGMGSGPSVHADALGADAVQAEDLAATEQGPLRADARWVGGLSTVRGADSKRTTRPPAPVMLWAAACVLARDTAALETQVRAARARKREDAAEWALVWVDATDLAGRVKRRRGAEAGRCRAPKVRATVRALRALVGPTPSGRNPAQRYEGGLKRLESELQVYAGLARP